MTENVLLRDLFHRRWSMPALAMLYRWQGAKFVTLHKKLDASAGSMRTTIDHLITQGYVQRNPGYGHPMRPEYILDSRGFEIGVSCDELIIELDELNVRQLALSKWSLPAVAALGKEQRRFNEIRASCPSVTDRALTQSLKSLINSHLVSRKVEETFPPTVTYSLTTSGKKLLPLLNKLKHALAEQGLKS